MGHGWDRVVLYLSFVSFCSCATLSSNNKVKTSSFGSGLATNDDFQTWEDWMTKRGLNGAEKWNAGELFGSGDKFQQWRDWMYKRGFGGPGTPFGSLDRTQFQGWKEWASKRSLGNAAPFPAFGDMDKSQFQQWGDWVAKRGFNMPVDGFGSAPGESGSFQSWQDFVKRHNYPFLSGSMNGLDKEDFQTWQDWVKRGGMMPGGRAFFGGYTFGNRDKFMNWQDLFKKSADKRQLGYLPDGFGSFRSYFTDGLQDWRSTFKGAKRSKAEDESKEKQ